MAKPHQEELPVEGPGVAPVKIPALEKLARKYIEDRDERLAALQAEVVSKTKLVEALHFHTDQISQPDGALVYRFGDTIITLEPGKEKLKVTEYEEPEIVDG